MEHDETNCSTVLVGASNSDLGFETTTKTTSGFISVFVSWVSRKTGNCGASETFSTGSLDDMPWNPRVETRGLGLREAAIAGSFRLRPKAFAQQVGMSPGIQIQQAKKKRNVT